MMGGLSRYCSILLLVMISTLYAADSFISVRVDQANFRAGPDLESRVKWDLEKYYPLSVKKRAGDWYRVVDYCGNEGWVHQITVDDPARSVVVNGNDVNIRQSAGLDAKVTGSAYKGEIFFVVDQTDEWAEVQNSVDSRKGFIYKQLLWGI
jgi:SH3-like domain-containing protein